MWTVASLRRIEESGMRHAARRVAYNTEDTPLVRRVEERQQLFPLQKRVKTKGKRKQRLGKGVSRIRPSLKPSTVAFLGAVRGKAGRRRESGWARVRTWGRVCVAGGGYLAYFLDTLPLCRGRVDASRVVCARVQQNDRPWCCALRAHAPRASSARRSSSVMLRGRSRPLNGTGPAVPRRAHLEI
jgi:hypothetical protein